LKAPEMRQRHLRRCHDTAEEAGDEEKATAIMNVIRREASRKR
jgi:hypothetical protein